MTTTTFALKIGYTTYFVTPANAAKVMEILSAARCASPEYLRGENQYVEGRGEALSFEVFDKPVLTAAQRDELNAQDRAEWEVTKAQRAAALAEKEAAEA